MTRATTDRLSEPSDPLMCSSPTSTQSWCSCPDSLESLGIRTCGSTSCRCCWTDPRIIHSFRYLSDHHNHHNHHKYSISSKHLKTPQKNHDQLQHSPGFLVTPSLHHHLPHHRRLCVAFCKKPTQALAASRAPPKASCSCWCRLGWCRTRSIGPIPGDSWVK